LERQRTLLDLLRDSVRRVRRLHPFHIDDWVVLPDHMHCIWTLPPDTDDFPMRWRLIKLLFSKGLPPTERLSATRQRRTERGIWQRRYWEHTIVIERDYAQHVDYIHVSHSNMSMYNGFAIGHIQLFIAMLPMAFCRSIGAAIWSICRLLRND